MTERGLQILRAREAKGLAIAIDDFETAIRIFRSKNSRLNMVKKLSLACAEHGICPDGERDYSGDSRLSWTVGLQVCGEGDGTAVAAFTYGQFSVTTSGHAASHRDRELAHQVSDDVPVGDRGNWMMRKLLRSESA